MFFIFLHRFHYLEGHDSVTSLNWTPSFEWYVGKCGARNEYQKDICLKGIGLHAQKYDNQFRFKCEHNLGGHVWPHDEHENLHFDNE